MNVIRSESYLMQTCHSMNWDFTLLDITPCSLHMLFTRVTCVIRMLGLGFLCGRHEKKVYWEAEVVTAEKWHQLGQLVGRDGERDVPAQGLGQAQL